VSRTRCHPVRLVSAGLLAACCTGLIGAGPALAADAYADIDNVGITDGSVEVLVSLHDLPTGATPDPSAVEATLDGDPVAAQAQLATEAVVGDGTRLTRTVVLAVDTSLSMRGERFEAAKTAATAFVDQAPEDVAVALVGFADEATVVAEATTDRDALELAVDSLALTRQTRLYDGVRAAIAVAAASDAGSVLVLSDGRDTSGEEVDGLVASVAESGVQVDVVALEQADDQLSVLEEIAVAGYGRVIDIAGEEDLTALFSEQAAVLATQVLVTFEVPGDWAGGGTDLEIGVDAGDVSYSDNAYVTIPSAAGQSEAAPEATSSVAASGIQVSESLMIAGIAAIGLAMAVIAVSLTGAVNLAERQSVQERLAAYGSGSRRRAEGSGFTTPGDPAAGMKQQAVQLTERAMSSGLEVKVAKRLEAAGIKLNSAEWFLLHLGIAVGLPMLGFLISGNVILAVMAFIVGLVAPWLYLGLRASRRIKKFNAQLADTLGLISGSLSAGLSFTQSLDTVVREGTEPVAGEFRRALVEQRLGVGVEDALNGVAGRMKSDDFAWVVMAVRIQREVGGNLAELLLTVADTLREREYLRRQVSTLSAEGRLSAWILGGLPPLFVAFLALTRGEYLSPMYTHPLGWIMSGVAMVMMVVGVCWLKKTVKVEV